ncbi:MAG TPA: hypothetical protein VFY06_06655 [Verrucomicrobiae bacterium]|nr:hypothetical protein [Verrucomicrobiae bacterium]
MKTRLALFMLVSAFSLFPSALLHAGTTIDTANHYTYGANLGWMDWRGDTASGAAIGEYICSGYIYSANVGWISLGSSTPADGIYYQNNSATDWGVNQDGLGNLRGYAWGANIGWINFEKTGAPKVDLYTGKLSGYIYSANCGWISLSNAYADLQTDTIAPGTDTDGDGIPDAWELQEFGNLTTANATSDFDGDGVSDRNEYLAGTNPKDGSSFLHITSIARGGPSHATTHVTLQWTSVPNRFYAVQAAPSLGQSPFADIFAISFPGPSLAGFDDYSTNDFYRIRVFRPLMP